MPRAQRGALVMAAVVAIGLTPHGLTRAATAKPPLHGRHWVAITGKPLGATAGALIFARGGNAVDAACAMLAATTTMWDTLSWGGETQALVYNPRTGKVIGVNALGMAPTGATPAFFKSREMVVPPEFGPLAAVTPGTPGGLMVMLAEWGRLSLADVLAPAIQMADGYPIEAQLVRTIELPAPGREARGAGGGRGLPPGRSCGHAAQARAGRAAGPARQEEPQGRDHGRLRPLLQRRHRGRAGARHARAGRADHQGRPGELEGAPRGAGQHDIQGDRRLQAQRLDAGAGHAAGAQHPGERRSQGHGLQLRALRPHRLPGDEPGLRRPRLLLRRHLLSARGAGEGTAQQGVREAAAGPDERGGQRSGRAPGRSLSLPGRREPLPRRAGRLADDRRAQAQGDAAPRW